MATTPRVRVPDRARDEEGVASMTKVIEEHAPELMAARTAFFAELSGLVAEAPAAHELVRLATAEMTGCRLCRNIRSAAARDAGVDEETVERVRRGEHDTVGELERAALELGDRLRAHPGDLEQQAAPELRELGPRLGTALVASSARAVADGKALVALGLEPEQMKVRVG